MTDRPIMDDRLTNTEILIFICGYQGGTVHQLAEKLGTVPNDILWATPNRMQDLMRLAQKYRNDKDQALSQSITDEDRKAALEALDSIFYLNDLDRYMVGRFEDSNVDTEVRTIRSALQRPAVPPGYALVPIDPTEEMWGGLARDIVMWTRLFRGSHSTGITLRQHLTACGREIPDWLEKEIPDSDSVPPKGTIAAVIYRAMIAAAPKGERL